MNHCRRCESDYEKPGTCNCFAEKQEPSPVFVPVWPQPWWAGPYYWGPTFTTSPCPVCGVHNCGLTHTICGDDLSGNATTVIGDDLAPAITTAALVTWGKSMMGGDTSHMVDS